MVQSCCHFQVVMLHRLASLCSQPFLRTVETVIHNKIGQIGAIGTGMTTIMHRYDYVYTKVYITVYIMVCCMVYITVYHCIYHGIYSAIYHVTYHDIYTYIYFYDMYINKHESNLGKYLTGD